MFLLSKLAGALKHRGLQIALILTAYLIFASSLPLTTHQTFYTMSIFIKDILMWVLPITVGLFIAQTISSFERHAPLFVLALMAFEALSNLTSVWYAYAGGHVAVDYVSVLKLPSGTDDFTALWRIPFLRPSWWSADKGTMAGVFIGFLAALTKNGILKHKIEQGKELAQWVLTRIFSRLIPLFILGFVARMYQMKMLQHLLAQYSFLLVWLLAFLALYLFGLFFLGSGSLKGAFQAIKNLLPAGGIAFSSGCSISTMPWTIEGSSKNLQDPSLAKAVIPATTNIQQIGDCITNTFLCFLIYRQFYGACPDFTTWLNFSLVFVLARFATAAVLGGAIFIMLPIYETYLSFTPEMIAIILAFNVILDPIVTSCNVLANGALCRVFERVWNPLLRKTQALFNPKNT